MVWAPCRVVFGNAKFLQIALNQLCSYLKNSDFTRPGFIDTEHASDFCISNLCLQKKLVLKCNNAH